MVAAVMVTARDPVELAVRREIFLARVRPWNAYTVARALNALSHEKDWRRTRKRDMAESWAKEEAGLERVDIGAVIITILRLGAVR